MDIKAFTITDLKKAINQNILFNGEIVPITKHRAISQTKNPRADKSDIVLLIGYEDDRIVGYLGILPDKIFIKNTEEKLGWLSTWWVDPNQIKSGVGLLLLYKAFHYYNQNVAVSSFSESAFKIYQASKKFITLKNAKGVNLLFRFNSNYLLQKKFPKLHMLRPILRFLDHIANIFINFRLSIWSNTNSKIYKNIKTEYISYLDEETKKFLDQHRRDELFKRDVEELNWIINHPWLLATPLRDNISEKYFFSSSSKNFSYLNIKIFDDNHKMISFIVLKTRDSWMEVPYSYFHTRYTTSILYVIACHVIKMNVDLLSIYNDEFIENLPYIKLPFLYKRDTLRKYIISTKFNRVNFDSYYIQDGDGDCVFT